MSVTLIVNEVLQTGILTPNQERTIDIELQAQRCSEEVLESIDRLIERLLDGSVRVAMPGLKAVLTTGSQPGSQVAAC